jgi:hypothetical protein
MARSPDSDPEVLARLWARLGDADCAVIHEAWPRERDLSFLEALAEEAPEQARDLTLAHEFLKGLLRVAIIAVAGLLNAGKSSLVASFLSTSGRPRVLRGVGRGAGTHRFTLWCPAAWQANAGFREPLESLLQNVFGQPVESLSSVAEEAHAQQRDRGRLGTPLLAFDPGLDGHRLCLLDCPDIQRAEPGDLERRRTRRQMLEAAASICSGVFIVLPRHQLEVEQVGDVMEALPRVPRVLAINFCSGEPPETVAEEARAAWGDVADIVYVAYDFRHTGYERLTPSWDPNHRLAPTDAFPCFFAVATDSAANQPAAVASSRDLHRFAELLPPDRLLQQRQRELLLEFRQRILAGGQRLVAQAEVEAENLSRASAWLQTELDSLLERDGDLRIKLHPRLIEDFATSIRRTAPLDLKPFIWVSQKTGVALRTIRSLVRGVSARISDSIQEEGRRIGSVLADARLDADRLAERLRLWSAMCREARDHAFWLPAAERILDRYQRYEEERLPQKEWDERARDLWRAMPIWRARAAVVTTVLVAMAAVALLSVAGGPVLVALGLKSAALTVTVKELLVVVGLGSIAQGEAARRLDEWLRARVGAQQRSALLAAAFDEVGLPRSALGALNPAPAIEENPRRDGFAVRELKARVRTWNVENWRMIEKALRALET